MIEQVKDKIGALESLYTNFISCEKDTKLIKQKVTDLKSGDSKSKRKLPLSFEYLLVDISRNGGRIATCKQNNYKDLHNTGINTNIIVMHQNAEKKYYIPIDWKYKDSYIVNLEYNDKEQLYGFCSNGDIRKIDTLTESAKLKLTSSILTDEGIVKAKLCDKGFIVLTKKGNIYYAPDIKNPKPIFYMSIKDKLNFSNDIDFLGIPAAYSSSKKVEILVLNEKGKGVLLVRASEEESTNIRGERNNKNANIKLFDPQDGNINKYEFIEETPQPPESNTETPQTPQPKDSQKTPTPQPKQTEQPPVIQGKINAFCLSPCKDKIAFYCADNTTIYIYDSNLEKKNSLKKIKIDINNIKLESNDDLTKEDIQEFKTIFSYNLQYQFLFCGSFGVALCGQRSLVLATLKGEVISFVMSDVSINKALAGGPLYKCISEIDGIRVYTKRGVYLITKVPQEIINISDPFSKHPAKNLLNAYGYFLSKNADCDKIIRDIAHHLPDAITTLQLAAVNLFFTDDSDEIDNAKDLQMFLVKAAQYGKSFVQKGDFNYEKYVEKCKVLRIINSLRNLEKAPRFLTYEEYMDMEPDNPDKFMKIIMKFHNYKFAFELNNYLGYESDKIYLEFCAASIRRLFDDKDVNGLFTRFTEKLEECPNISYITLAKKCIKNKRFRLAEKFLEQEKSIVVKVPQYLELKNWDKALDLAIESNDRTVIKVVIDKIFKVEQKDKFIEIVGNKPKAHKAVIEYLKMHEHSSELDNYLTSKKDYEELLFIALESFFKCKSLDGREDFIKKANTYVKEMKGMPNFEFYKNYLKDLEYSLKFKKTCIDKGYIASNDISPFDNSIFDCYKLGIEKNKDLKCITDGNKQFNIGQKKITYIKFKNWADTNKIDNIEKEISNVGYKKLDITPLIVAKIFYNIKDFERATKYAVESNDPIDFDEKIKLLKKMNKHEIAIDQIMKEKKIDKEEYLEGILKEKPELKAKIDSYNKK